MKFVVTFLSAVARFSFLFYHSPTSMTKIVDKPITSTVVIQLFSLIFHETLLYFSERILHNNIFISLKSNLFCFFRFDKIPILPLFALNLPKCIIHRNFQENYPLQQKRKILVHNFFFIY